MDAQPPQPLDAITAFAVPNPGAPFGVVGLFGSGGPAMDQADRPALWHRVFREVWVLSFASGGGKKARGACGFDVPRLVRMITAGRELTVLNRR